MGNEEPVEGSIIGFVLRGCVERGSRWETFLSGRPRNLGNSLHGENCGKMKRKYLRYFVLV